MRSLRWISSSLSSAPQRREQHRVLEGEVVLGVVVDRLEPWGQRLGRAPNALVPASVELEVVLDEAAEGRARRSAQALLVVAHPAVELGADQVEVRGWAPRLRSRMSARAGCAATP